MTPWRRSNPSNEATDTAQTRRAWWEAPTDTEGAAPIAPEFDAVEGGTPPAAPSAMPDPSSDDPASPPPLPKRRAVLGGLPYSRRASSHFAPPEAADSQPPAAAEQEPVPVPVPVPVPDHDHAAAELAQVPQPEIEYADAEYADAEYAAEYAGEYAGEPSVPQGFDEAAPVTGEVLEPGDLPAVTDVSATDEPAFLETRIDQTSGEVATNEAGGDQATYETPTYEAPTDETPTYEAPTDETPLGDQAANEAPAYATPLGDPATYAAPTDETPLVVDQATSDQTAYGAPTDETPLGDALDASTEARDPITANVSFPVTPVADDVPVPVAEIGVGFGERIERLIAAAVAEAENTRVDAENEAAQVVETARLDAEHTVAAAQRQAAELITVAQHRCEEELAASHRIRQEAEQVLADARREAEEVRLHARDEVTDLRAEIDQHAQSMLARTHEETGRTLATARAELDELAVRKSELEAQLTSIRSLLADTVVEPMPLEVSGFLGTPAQHRMPDDHEADAPADGVSTGSGSPTDETDEHAQSNDPEAARSLQ